MLVVVATVVVVVAAAVASLHLFPFIKEEILAEKIFQTGGYVINKPLLLISRTLWRNHIEVHQPKRDSFSPKYWLQPLVIQGPFKLSSF